MTNNEKEKDNKNKSETAKREEEILKFWRENKIFEKTLAKSSPKGEFVFYDGPPFATGLPHYGSLLSSIAKDVIPRYKTMRGYHVRRRWGWDCHGLPIENMIEKRLGLKTKKEIEAMGVDKFNETCRSAVLETASDWKNYVERVGRWVDFDNSYKTMDNSYIESVWWALKEIHKKGLLCEGRKVLMYCPRCETPLAKAEVAMDNSYKTVMEEATTVKFKLKPGQKIGGRVTDGNTFILAWTTTPWTLPGNAALAINRTLVYCQIKNQKSKIKSDEESFILAKERLNVLTEPYEIIREFKGENLIGLEYEPLYEILSGENVYRVVEGNFVTAKDGTGIVHINPTHGEDDYNVGVKYELPTTSLLDASGHFNEKAPEFIRGFYLKKGEKYVKEDLEKRGLIFAKNAHTHSYPHCHRCDTPLYYSALSSWFINIQKIKDKLIELNEKINWQPDYLKHGRFLNIVKDAPDWNISRNRYWASPLPIWKCQRCEKVELIGSLDELKNKTKKSGNRYFMMRHGEGTHNTENIISFSFENSFKYPLTENGKKQILESLKGLRDKKIDLIFYSDFLRTKETAFLVAENIGLDGKNIREDKRLRELDAGFFEGKDSSYYGNYFSEKKEEFYKNSPDGENLNDLKKRVGDFIYEIDKKFSGKNILIISHAGPIWMMFSVAEGLDEKESIALKNKIRTKNNDDEIIKTGEVKELDFFPLPHNRDFTLDLHRPYIDEVEIACDKCGEKTKRTPEVLDGWFESGAMPFAEYHYPFENKKELGRRFPSGDFVSEYIAQTRTWFYYMHAISAMLFDDVSFKNVITTGNILAEDGGKMSKSKGNYTDPMENLDKYGADALRFYLMASPVMRAEDIKFTDEEIKDAQNKTVNILLNVFKFFELYGEDCDGETKSEDSENVLDKWILAKFSVLAQEVTEGLENYNTVKAGRPIKDFINEFSTWYVRRSRDRIKGDDEKDKQFALATMKRVLMELSKIIAPFMPFIAEDIYRKVGGGKESVHLEEWIKKSEIPNSKAENLMKEMEEIRKIASLGLEARAKAGIKVRQPLASLKIKSQISNLKTGGQMIRLIKDELNVKGVIFDDKISSEVELDAEISLELREEGALRDLIRSLQELRKKSGLNPNDKIALLIQAEEQIKKFIEKFADEIKKSAGIEKMEFNVALEDGQEISTDSFAVKVKIERSN
ncbi:MAG: class I tRNA ligase family protein [Patescibacteria group bacterium]|nr:class I tRNA ligase family protein [Patescibacteria group bacterium]MDE2218105.1 class I tRNA ligase family protein [Patescibacteria group bacterium]